MPINPLDLPASFASLNFSVLSSSTYLKQYAAAVDDCTASIERDAQYSKAYVRLGTVHRRLGDWSRAIEAYEVAIRLDPANASVREQLDALRAKAGPGADSLKSTSTAAMPAGGTRAAPPGMPDLGAMAGLLNDPNSPLAGLMQNPQMMQMAQQMMSDPAMMQQAMGALAGLGGGGSGGMGEGTGTGLDFDLSGGAAGNGNSQGGDN